MDKNKQENKMEELFERLDNSIVNLKEEINQAKNSSEIILGEIHVISSKPLQENLEIINSILKDPVSKKYLMELKVRKEKIMGRYVG
jgi:hypothetical protein